MSGAFRGPALDLSPLLPGAGALEVLHRRTRPPAAPVGTPTVTVVVPCFRYADYLPAAVRSALDQSGVSVDVVVVDDHSPDDSLAVARRLAEHDPRVTVIAQPVNRGPVATFNAGLAAVTGEYVVRLDADDVLTPGSLARATALAEAQPGVGLVYGHPVHFSGDHLPPARTDVRAWTVWSGRSWLELRARWGVNCITSPEVLMRTSVVAEVGGQRDLAHTHDMEMWMRLARVSDVGWLDGCDQAWHREHDSSRSARDVDVLTDLRERAEAYTVLFTDGAGDPATDRRLLDLAHRALATEALTRICQAHVAGWAGGPTTDAYEDFARTLVPDLGSLPVSNRLRRSRRVGNRWARWHPALVLPALLNRGERELRGRLWRATGL